MDESHEWLTKADLDNIRFVAGAAGLRENAILNRLLADLEATKALLFEALDFVDNGTTDTRLAERIRRVPGVEA